MSSVDDGIWASPVDDLPNENTVEPFIGATLEHFENDDSSTSKLYYCEHCLKQGMFMNKCDCEGIFCLEEGLPSDEDSFDAVDSRSFSSDDDLSVISKEFSSPAFSPYPTCITLEEYLARCGLYSRCADTHMCDGGCFNFGYYLTNCDDRTCHGTHIVEIDYNDRVHTAEFEALPHWNQTDDSLTSAVQTLCIETLPNATSVLKSKNDSAYLSCLHEFFDTYKQQDDDDIFFDSLEYKSPSTKLTTAESFSNLNVARTPNAAPIDVPNCTPTSLLTPNRAHINDPNKTPTDIPICSSVSTPISVIPSSLLVPFATNTINTHLPNQESSVNTSPFRATILHVHEMTLTTCLSTACQIWKLNCSNLFWTLTLFLSSIIWDTILLLYSPTTSPSLPRRRRRSKHKWRRWAYPKSWMMLSCFMMSTSTTPNPIAIMTLTTAGSVLATYRRSERLSILLDMDFSVLSQFHHSKYDDLIELKLSYSTVDNSITPTSRTNSGKFTEDDLSQYLDSRSEQASDTFFDCQEPEKSFDPFKFDMLTAPHVHVHCSPSQTNLDDDLSSIPLSYNASQFMGKVDLFGTSLPGKFPVIFDSGASLAISPDKQDFSGPIEMFDYDRRLGGMAKGMRIEGVGTIKWSFKTKTGILTIHSRCYYVPAAGAHLISPQRLFNKLQGVTGSFIVSETEAKLVFDNVGTLEIPYDTRSHLPIGLAKNLSSEKPQANLCILNEANQNLTPAQKLLLTWHARFGHRGFQSMQRLFKCEPFLYENSQDQADVKSLTVKFVSFQKLIVNRPKEI